MSPLFEIRPATLSEVNRIEWRPEHPHSNNPPQRYPLYERVIEIINEAEVVVLSFSGPSVEQEVYKEIAKLRTWGLRQNIRLAFRINEGTKTTRIFIKRRD